MACKDRERKGRELRWHYWIDSGQTHQHGAEEISVKVGEKTAEKDGDDEKNQRMKELEEQKQS